MTGIAVAFFITWACIPATLAAQRESPLHDVTLRLTSVADSGSYLVYTYGGFNSRDSKGSTATIALDLAAPSRTGYVTLPSSGAFVDSSRPQGMGTIREHVPLGSIAPDRWVARLAKDGWLYWSGLGGDPPRQLGSIAPGDTLRGFGVRSAFLPGIRGSFAEPTDSSCCGGPPPARGPRPRPDRFRVFGWTVAPTYARGQVTLDVLGGLLDRSCGELAWISQATICSALTERLKEAVSKVRSGDRDGGTAALRALLEVLDTQRGNGKSIADNAYWLLRVNAGYLIAHATTAVWHDSFPQFAAREFAALKKRGTVAEWVRVHPTDTLETFAPPAYQTTENWCARATFHQRLPDGSGAVRQAYFYAPPLGPKATLPAPASPEEIASQCVLGAVWATVESPTVADAVRLGSETADSLIASYGGVPRQWPPGDELPFVAGYELRVLGPWTMDSTTIFTAAETRLLFRHAPRASAVGLASLSGLDRPPPKTFAEQYKDDSAFVAEGAALTGLEAPKGRPLFALLAQAESARAGLTHPDHAQLVAAAVSTIWHWLEYARPLDPPRRAGAYLAADRVLGNDAVGLLLWNPVDSVAGRRPLERWGAEFEGDYDGGLVYAHSWLAEAVSLAPMSRAGNLAFLEHIGGCDPGPVIEQGEDFMQNLSDPALRAQLHFTLGDAYADSVGLASQVYLGTAYRDNVHDAPTARAKAIEHYRAGLAIDETSTSARAAWRKAWRLLAGLSPLGLRFHCEAD